MEAIAGRLCRAERPAVRFMAVAIGLPANWDRQGVTGRNLMRQLLRAVRKTLRKPLMKFPTKSTFLSIGFAVRKIDWLFQHYMWYSPLVTRKG
jgi:hypothetical protein